MESGAKRHWVDSLEVLAECIPMSMRELWFAQGRNIRSSFLSTFAGEMIFRALPMLTTALKGQYNPEIPSESMERGLQEGLSHYFTEEERANRLEVFAEVSAIVDALRVDLQQADHAHLHFSVDQMKKLAIAYVDASFFVVEVRERTACDRQFFNIETEDLALHFSELSEHDRCVYSAQVMWRTLKDELQKENIQARDMLAQPE